MSVSIIKDFLPQFDTLANLDMFPQLGDFWNEWNKEMDNIDEDVKKMEIDEDKIDQALNKNYSVWTDVRTYSSFFGTLLLSFAFLMLIVYLKREKIYQRERIIDQNDIELRNLREIS